MKALTLWRPWPVLIVRGIKRIENRKWSPGARLMVGEYFAIHAGKTWDPDCCALAEARGVDMIEYWYENCDSAIVGVAQYGGVVTQSEDPWFFGPFGWLLANPIKLASPVPCKGAQGLWALPPEVERAVCETRGEWP